ncbi:MAG TPA: MMPL family transporter [Acidobacteriota bacterium]|nr:MMPL family transporter [Acidobacteriota bacterium]
MSDPRTDNVTRLARLYDRTVLRHPLAIVLLYAAGVLFFGYHLRSFRMDASSDSLVLENDSDLKYYEATRALFGTDDYIILAISLQKSVISDQILRMIEAVSSDLQKLPSVESVKSILTVPLFESPKVTLYDMGSSYKTLLMPSCERELAFRELTTSPLWRDNLLSGDGTTTAVVLTMKPDKEYKALGEERYRLRRKRAEGRLSDEESARLALVSRQYDARHAEISAQRRSDVKAIRDILQKYKSASYSIAESGLPMIVADMVSYIERDIWVFGIAVILFLGAVLGYVFRLPKWVLLPLVTCLIPVVFMMGYLGLTGWETTVVTANFSSLLLIVSMQNSIYLVVRFREIHARYPEMDKGAILFQSVRQISVPCFYTSATQVAGFATLVISGIRPVIDFGILMATGLALAYAVNFTFFPAAILLFPKGAAPPRQLATLEKSPVAFLASFTRRNRAVIGTLAGIVLAIGVTGMLRLRVENRFIDYFRKNTPISQGLMTIDHRLGGTTSLEVVLDGGQPDFWLEPRNLETLRKIHKYVEGLPNVGKVSSLYSLIEILTRVNNGVPPNQFVLNIARTSLSEDMQQAYLRPYVTKDFSQARVFVRIRESSPTLNRDSMLQQLRGYLRDDLKLPENEARITGLFVLYNNLLKSLFDSQIKTLGLVFLVIYLMLVGLFRSLHLAVIAIIPATLPVFLILGTMGWLNISLDMMTIMIASVTCGIAVDNMIQYTFRYREEFFKDRDYGASMFRSHNSIGLAILYASLTIIAGFGILTLSNFIPTIYFGLFTSMAMAAGLSGSLTLLPMLLGLLKPFGKE